jgi:two-component system, chemotaxis family, CheB/CheR fusion protein
LTGLTDFLVSVSDLVNNPEVIASVFHYCSLAPQHLPMKNPSRYLLTAHRENGTDANVTSYTGADSAGGSPASSNIAAEEGKGVTFPIVGVGASAGGLEAFSQLLRHLPPDTGMAFVFIQHLDPHHASALPTLLQRESTMPVTVIVDGAMVKPNHVHVIPPDSALSILHGALHLMPRDEKQRPHWVIDEFFRSLAEDQGSRAIGVILSGTASDGVLGLKAIKAEGGITFSQDEQSAKYDGMPRSAIAAGCVDFVLPPEKIAQELMRIVRHPHGFLRTRELSDEGPAHDENSLCKLFVLLRRYSGVDFTYYKRKTIQRRLKRRLVLNQLKGLADYIRFAQDNPQEIDALYNDILINVTAFFRDPASFDALKNEIFPIVLKQERRDNAPIRIWSPGCSTGEEVNSIAICLLEKMEETGADAPIQLFGTDIDELALKTARAGVYSENINQDVSAARLRRFFSKVEGGYQIDKRIRDMCLFARQDLIRDPPFCRLDLISCRNLLIYLGPVLQKKLFSLFHYALKPAGFLFLGSAETIGDAADLFKVVAHKHKIYEKKWIATPLPLDLSMPPGGPLMAPSPGQDEKPNPVPWSSSELCAAVDRMIIKRYSPPGIVINDRMDILQFVGQTGDFLELAPGDASLNLLKMIREDLFLDVHTAVVTAIKDNSAVRKEGVRLKEPGGGGPINIDIMPIKTPEDAERFFLVLFEKAAETTPKRGSKKPKGEQAAEDTQSEVIELRHELAATKEYLQSVIERQESSNEELRSANEEAQSSNEEMQSINEELETAREELQSVNEELATVNDELECRNSQLTQLNNDLNNLIGNVDIPIVIVGADLHIRRFTPQAGKTLNLRAHDVGRPLSDIRLNISDVDLNQLVQETIDTVCSREAERQDREGRWHSIRVRPYCTLDKRIDGAVITFVDIQAMRQSLDIAKDARDFAEAMIATIKQPLLAVDKDLRVLSASAAYLNVFKVTEKETVGNLLYRLGNGQWGIPALRARLDNTLAGGEPFDDFIVEHEFENIGRLRLRVGARRIPSGASRPALILMQIEVIPPESDHG